MLYFHVFSSFGCSCPPLTITNEKGVYFYYWHINSQSILKNDFSMRWWFYNGFHRCFRRHNIFIRPYRVCSLDLLMKMVTFYRSRFPFAGLSSKGAIRHRNPVTTIKGLCETVMFGLFPFMFGSGSWGGGWSGWSGWGRRRRHYYQPHEDSDYGATELQPQTSNPYNETKSHIEPQAVSPINPNYQEKISPATSSDREPLYNEHRCELCCNFVCF